MRGAFYAELRQAAAVSRCLQSWRSAMRFARRGSHKLYLRLRAQRDAAIGVAEARGHVIDAMTQERDDLRSALSRLCNAVSCHPVADGLTDSELIALAERLSHDDPGNDC